VRLLPSSRVIEINMVHSSQEVAMSILRELVAVNEEEDAQRKLALGKKMIAALSEEKSDLTKQLSEVAMRINAIQDEIPSPQPSLLSQLDTEMVTLEREIAKVSAERDSLKDIRLNEVGLVALLPEMSEDAARDLGADSTTYFRLRSNYDQIKVEHARVSSMYGPNHPDRKRVEANLRDLMSRLAEYLNAARGQMEQRLDTFVRQRDAMKLRREALALEFKDQNRKMSEKEYDFFVLQRTSLLSRLQALGGREDQIRVFQKIQQPALIVVDQPQFDASWSGKHIAVAQAFAGLGVILLFFFLRMASEAPPPTA
jgi:uncharacterized protein involved in exopolysaccharide biosynthesis